MKETSVVVSDDDVEVNSGPYIDEGRRHLQVATDFEVGLKGAGTALQGAVADLEG